MKCRYKQKLAEEAEQQAEQREMEVYGELSDQFLAFLDYTKGMAMHELFGHGKERLDKLYDEHLSQMATYLDRYEDKDNADPDEYSRNTNALFDLRLRDVGVDIEALKKEYVIVDRYKEPALQKQREFRNPIHETRAIFVQEFDKYATGSVSGLLSYVNVTYGYGKVRLERLFHWIWGRYVKFCEHYLLTNKEGNAAMIFLLKSTQEYLKTLNLEIFREDAS